MSSVESLSTAGGCQLAERLGFNGAVATYKGVLTANLRNVCVVALDKSQLGHLPALSRFRDEFSKVLAANPEGVALAVDHGEESGYIWAAYEYMKGGHLGSHIRDRGLPTSSEAVTVLASVVGSLINLHRAGVAHRVITPASIFIREPGEVRLMHAGWASLLLGVHGGPAHPFFMSNLPFLAPEVAKGEKGDLASDVYSLGANLYFLVTGQPTMWADDPAELARTIATTPVNLESERETLPWDLTDLLDEMLAFEPEDRPLNLEALKERMDMLAEKLAAAPAEEPDDLESISPGSHAATRPDVEPPSEPPTMEATQPNVDPPSHPMAMAATHHDVDPQRSSSSEPDSPMAQSGYGDPKTDPETARLLQMARSARDESHRLSQSGSGFETPQFDPKTVPGNLPTPLPAPIYAPPPSTAADGSSGGFNKLLLIVGAIVVLLIIVGAGWGAMIMVSSMSSPSTPARQTTGTTAQQDRQPRQSQAERQRQEYETTVNRLRQMAMAQRAYAEEFGVWVRHPNQLDSHSVPPEMTEDAWGTPMEYRQRFVVSAGPDKRWDIPERPSPDDIWINSETMEIGGWTP